LLSCLANRLLTGHGPCDELTGSRWGGYWTTRGYDNSRIAKSRTGRLADWTSRGLVNSRTIDNSRTGQVADWTTRGCHRRLCVQFFSFMAASARPRVVQSSSWRIRELSSYRCGNLLSRPTHTAAGRFATSCGGL